jgi:hypothetical protein
VDTKSVRGHGRHRSRHGFSLACVLLINRPGGLPRMMTGRSRERSGSELAFGLLKSLMIGYRLWGTESVLELSELPTFLGTTGSRLGSVLSLLVFEGLICLDQTAGTVRLSASGARNLLGETSH